jgi:ABC-type multidrug transport system fused ATPase/permease subunit
VKRLEGELEFRNVSFSYNGRERVLKDISFHIRRGERFAIVGPSGVGKTTLISLILRFYRPTAGEIYFDRRAASSLELSSLRRRIGYVSQRPALVSGTIQENIAYGNPGAEREQVQRAARAAGIHDFIMSMPGGYGTALGEGGVIPSEGQMQRLSIARALVMDPDILVLDEPTSALDRKLERSIFDSLPGLLRNKTLCLVSHRASSLKEADRILILKDGSVVAQGDHPMLLETSQYYRSLALEETCMEMEMCHD